MNNYKYKNSEIYAWVSRTIGINSYHAGEVQTRCPKCGYDNFYFNIYKGVGVCHKARCNFTPSTQDLIDLVGFPPDKFGVYELEELKETQEELWLPGNKLAFYQDDKLMTISTEASDYLLSRGLSFQDIIRFNLHWDGKRIYVPIYDNGILVNYNSRLLKGYGRKYLYAKGRKTSKYIFGWSECKLWPRLTLVENTFVSIWLRNKSYCSTVFGSHLSKDHVDLICKSPSIKSVAILWDEGAESKAEKAVKALHKQGMPAAYFQMKKQPDDWPLDKIESWARLTHSAALRGEISYA